MDDSTVRILVVDDDKLQLMLIKSVLPTIARKNDTPFHFVIDSATDVDTALCLIDSKNEEYDFILSDIQMPGKDGFVLFSELKRRNYPASIIATSGNTKGKYFDRCLEAGCISFLPKPIRISELIDIIWHAVMEQPPKQLVNIG